MTLWRWAESTRDELREALPEGVAILPIGATEQHGPHLATGTDALIAGTVAERAAERAAPSAERDLVLAPCLPFGASDHHLAFGGTLSLSSETALAVLTDLGRSVVEDGGRRLVIVNGHGGNRGVCHAAAATLSSRHGLAVAIIHYWELLAPDETTPIPGHAGEFESSMVLAVRPDLVRDRDSRPAGPPVVAVEGADVHDAALWRRIDGFTDQPARATAGRGQGWLEDCVSALAERFADLTRVL